MPKVDGGYICRMVKRIKYLASNSAHIFISYCSFDVIQYTLSLVK